MASDLLGQSDKLPKAGSPLALIVAPTRELAMQVHRELSWLYQHAGARIVSCVGGMDPQREKRELEAGAHIVVGTPGRLCDHIRRKRLDITGLRVVVLDEADEMLDLGFREDMEFILKTTPETRRTLLFSATLPRTIISITKQYQNNPFRIEVTGGEGGHTDIEYRAIRVAPGDIEHAVVNVLRYYETPSAIVFCNTRNAVNHLQAALLERGFSVVALSGELTQNERTKALQSLRDGRSRVCVATDVAARGLDLPNLGLVIHADLPNDPEVLQHRSGRTGRAGKKGISVLLIIPPRRRRAETLLSMAGIDAEWTTPPTVEEIRKLDQQRMLKDPLFTEPSTDDDVELARTLLKERSAEDIAAALARLYRSRLPAPEDILDLGSSHRGYEERRSRNTASGGQEARKPRELRERQNFMSQGKSRRMTDGVWFRAAIGRRKNAEARWLLPMICRRGGIKKEDIGTIRIFDTTTEFEISSVAAKDFSNRIKRPDKEDNIRIEAMANRPQLTGESVSFSHAKTIDGRKPSRRERTSDEEHRNSTDGFRDTRSNRSEWPDRHDNDHTKKIPPRKGKMHRAEQRYDKDATERRDKRTDKTSSARPDFSKKKKKKNRN